MHRGRNTREENWLHWKGPTLFHLRCVLCHNFWTNYDHLKFSFVKDIKVVVEKMTRNCSKMIGNMADYLLCPLHSIQLLPLVSLPLWSKQLFTNFGLNFANKKSQNSAFNEIIFNEFPKLFVIGHMFLVSKQTSHFVCVSIIDTWIRGKCSWKLTKH